MAEVTLVDGKAFYEINWGSLRAITDTSFNVVHDYASIPGNARAPHHGPAEIMLTWRPIPP